jgi:hypothetical protein
MRQRSTQHRIGFDVGPASSQTGGPRAEAEVGALLVSTFYADVLGNRAPRTAPSRSRITRWPRA